MPSAEKLSSVATKLEIAPGNEPKSVDNTQKENVDQNEKPAPAINQVISCISNKIRNLEKRKASYRISRKVEQKQSIQKIQY